MRTVAQAIRTHRRVLPKSIRRQLEAKRLIFTVTAGRTGTAYLSTLLECVPGVSSFHEPLPKFSEVMRAAQSDPRAAQRFWIHEKLPAIALSELPIYVETSHLVCKGFLEPLIRLGVTPDVILLCRNRREIAKSLYLIAAVPGVTQDGLKFLLAPEDRGVLHLTRQQPLHDYQRCFWYVLEIERRQRLYERLIHSRGGRAVWSTLDSVLDEAGFLSLVQDLSLPQLTQVDLALYRRVRAIRVNTKSDTKVQLARSLPTDLDALEEEVLSLIDAEC